MRLSKIIETLEAEKERLGDLDVRTGEFDPDSGLFECLREPDVGIILGFRNNPDEKVIVL